jgi:LacI family transcriptional regulator
MSIANRTKYRAIANELESSIASDHWPVDFRLPGIRQLAEQYNVAPATAARALEVLIGKGLIEPDDRSGVYRVVAPLQNGLVEHWALCQRVTPGPCRRISEETTRRGFSEAGASERASIDFEIIPPDLDRPEAELWKAVRNAQDAGITGVFFMPSRISNAMMMEDKRFLSVCRQAGLPVVLIDRNLRGVNSPLEWDLVCADDFSGGLTSALHLLESGRSRLAFVRGSPTSSHNERLAGFLLAHHDALEPSRIAAARRFPIVLEYPEDPSSQRAYRLLCDQVLQAGVDGVVCYHDRVAFGLAIELLTRGKAVPGEVALTGFDDQTVGPEFTLGITSYAYPSREIALEALAAMRRRIKAPDSFPIKIVVPGRLVVRESSTCMPSRSQS